MLPQSGHELSGSLNVSLLLLAYSPSPPYIVIIIVALAEELLAYLILPAASLPGVAVSSLEMIVSLRRNRGNPTNMITKTITSKSIFTPTPSSFDYTISQPRIEDINNVLVVFIFG